MKTSPSPWLVSNSRCRFLCIFGTSLCFCLSPFNKLLFDVNLELFSDSFRVSARILTLPDMPHHSYVWIISVLVLCLLCQNKVCLTLHSCLVLVIGLFQKWRSDFVETTILVFGSIIWQAWVSALERGGLILLIIAVKCRLFFLIVLWIRIQHLKLGCPSTPLPVNDSSRSVLLRVWSLIMHHVSFQRSLLLLLTW